MKLELKSRDESAASMAAQCGNRAPSLALRLSCPPQRWQRRMSLAALRLVPTPKIKPSRTASQSVAVILGKAYAFVEAATVRQGGRNPIQKIAAKKHKRHKNGNPLLRLLRLFAAIPLAAIGPASVVSQTRSRWVKPI